jgi:tRNA uridine 5-carboxymethylaminomethyl modification enzyme
MNVPRGTSPRAFDVVIVGAGHAGCEAALACGRSGCSTALITLQKDRVGAMSCNPAIGGLGKSQIVREIDALGGEMGRAADAATIQFRRLNASRGPAVRARRVQCDMNQYHHAMLAALEDCEYVQILQGTVERLQTRSGTMSGVVLENGDRISTGHVVVTTGTFLRGLIHVGMDSIQGGRLGDPASIGLSDSLRSLGLELGRLKTGTPARLEASSVDLSRLEVLPPDTNRLTFSHGGKLSDLPQIECHSTRTNAGTHEVIRRSLARSPLFSGVIQGVGPRYCPSIEDKVVRFPDREGHQVILEPTDLTRTVLYPNGISTSLPRDVQEEMIHSIAGLEQARVIDYGYAIEYDFVHPTQLKPTLETKRIPGLFLAGQINGTSGYEEAAGQGLLAGLNAVASLKKTRPVILGRDEAYIGVMVDDLVTRGVTEPYRMFSSRAEFRLMLREDNAIRRLSKWARRTGLVNKVTLQSRDREIQRVEDLVRTLKELRVEKDEKGRRPTLEKVLRRPEASIEQFRELLAGDFGEDILEQAEVIIKYEGYIERQNRQARQMRQNEARKIPDDLDYSEVPGLSRELSEKLTKVKPTTFAQAARVDGMTPAALMVLSIWLGKTGDVPRETGGKPDGRDSR